MNKPVLFVCKSCGFSVDEIKRDGVTGGYFLLQKLIATAQSWERKSEIRIEPVGCLCICDRPCTVAIAHPDKPTFLFADLPPEDIADDLLKMCELYLDSEDGFVGRYLLSDRLQSSRIARIPSPSLLNKP